MRFGRGKIWTSHSKIEEFLQIEIFVKRQIDKQTEVFVKRQTYRQTDRQTNQKIKKCVSVKEKFGPLIPKLKNFFKSKSLQREKQTDRQRDRQIKEYFEKETNRQTEKDKLVDI